MNQPVVIPFKAGRLEVRRCSVDDLDALLDLLDLLLQRDFLFRRKHLEGVLRRENTRTWAIIFEGEFVGVCIIYKGSILHNLYLGSYHRSQGIGGAVIDHFQPERIRSKGNMKAGDPSGFYTAKGYVAESASPEQPHIVNMVKPKNPAQVAQLQKARAKQKEIREARKREEDRQRLVALGVSQAEIDKALPPATASAAVSPSPQVPAGDHPQPTSPVTAQGPGPEALDGGDSDWRFSD